MCMRVRVNVGHVHVHARARGHLVGGELGEVEVDRRRVGGHPPLERERRHPKRLGEPRRRRRERKHPSANRQRHRSSAEEQEPRLLLVEEIVVGELGRRAQPKGERSRRAEQAAHLCMAMGTGRGWCCHRGMVHVQCVMCMAMRGGLCGETRRHPRRYRYVRARMGHVSSASESSVWAMD